LTTHHHLIIIWFVHKMYYVVTLLYHALQTYNFVLCLVQCFLRAIILIKGTSLMCSCLCTQVAKLKKLLFLNVNGMLCYFPHCTLFYKEIVECLKEILTSEGHKHTKPPRNCSHKYNISIIIIFGNVWTSHLGLVLLVLSIFD
jgi:hypothetical protein